MQLRHESNSLPQNRGSTASAAFLLTARQRALNELLLKDGMLHELGVATDSRRKERDVTLAAGTHRHRQEQTVTSSYSLRQEPSVIQGKSFDDDRLPCRRSVFRSLRARDEMS